MYPGYIVAPWKPHNDLVPFDLRALENGLDLDDGFVPVRVVFGDARSGRLGHIPPMNIRDAPDDHEVRRVQPVLQILVTDLVLSMAGRGFAGGRRLGRGHIASYDP